MAFEGVNYPGTGRTFVSPTVVYPPSGNRTNIGFFGGLDQAADTAGKIVGLIDHFQNKADEEEKSLWSEFGNNIKNLDPNDEKLWNEVVPKYAEQLKLDPEKAAIYAQLARANPSEEKRNQDLYNINKDAYGFGQGEESEEQAEGSSDSPEEEAMEHGGPQDVAGQYSAEAGASAGQTDPSYLIDEPGQVQDPSAMIQQANEDVRLNRKAEAMPSLAEYYNKLSMATNNGVQKKPEEIDQQRTQATTTRIQKMMKANMFLAGYKYGNFTLVNPENIALVNANERELNQSLQQLLFDTHKVVPAGAEAFFNTRTRSSLAELARMDMDRKYAAKVEAEDPGKLERLRKYEESLPMFVRTNLMNSAMELAEMAMKNDWGAMDYDLKARHAAVAEGTLAMQRDAMIARDGLDRDRLNFEIDSEAFRQGITKQEADATVDMTYAQIQNLQDRAKIDTFNSYQAHIMARMELRAKAFSDSNSVLKSIADLNNLDQNPDAQVLLAAIKYSNVAKIGSAKNGLQVSGGVPGGSIVAPGSAEDAKSQQENIMVVEQMMGLINKALDKTPQTVTINTPGGPVVVNNTKDPASIQRALAQSLGLESSMMERDLQSLEDLGVMYGIPTPNTSFAPNSNFADWMQRLRKANSGTLPALTQSQIRASMEKLGIDSNWREAELYYNRMRKVDIDRSMAKKKGK